MFADLFAERLTYEIEPQWGGELPTHCSLAADGSVSTKLGAVDFFGDPELG